MRVEFTLLGFKIQRVDLKFCFTALGKVAMVFNLIRSVILNTIIILSSTSKSDVSPLPTVLILRNTSIHICTSNSGDIAFYIEELINKSFSR